MTQSGFKAELKSKDLSGKKPTFYLPLHTEDGIALIMVLWVVVLLSIVAVSYLGSSRANSASTRNLKEETISYYHALSGFHEALQYLMVKKDPSLPEFFDGNGNFWVDKDTPPITGIRTLDDGEVEIRITDEDSKININYTQPERMRDLFIRAGIPDDEVAGLLDAIQDWKGSGKEHRLLGAGNEYYESLPDPYKTKNANFDLPEELLLVKGMKPDYLYGSKEFQSLLPFITTFGRGSANINTVGKDVMELIGLNAFEIEAIMKQRTVESGGFRFAPEQFSSRGLGYSSSPSTLRIEVTARVSKKGRGARIVAVVSRQFAGKGYKLQTLYWRESAENIRG